MSTITFPVEIIQDIVKYADQQTLNLFCQLNKQWYQISLPKLYRTIPWLQTERFIRFMKGMNLAYRWRYDEFKHALLERRQIQSEFPMPVLFIQELSGPVKLETDSMTEFRKAVEEFPDLLRLSCSMSTLPIPSSFGIRKIVSDSNLISQPVLMSVIKLCKPWLETLSHDNAYTELVEELILIGCPSLHDLRVSSERETFHICPFETSLTPTTNQGSPAGMGTPTIRLSEATMDRAHETSQSDNEQDSDLPQENQGINENISTIPISQSPHGSRFHNPKALHSLKRLVVETMGLRSRYPLLNLQLVTPTLESITLNFVHLTDDMLRSILIANRLHLKSLTLGFVTGLSASAFRIIGVLAPNLKHINLTYTNIPSDATGRITQDCLDLQHLVLVGNHQIDDASIAHLCKHGRHLKRIVLGGMNLTYLSLESILHNCTQIEYLSFIELHKLTDSNLINMAKEVQDSPDIVRQSGWSSVKKIVFSSCNQLSAQALVSFSLSSKLKSLSLFQCRLPNPEELKMSVIPTRPLPPVNFDELRNKVLSQNLSRKIKIPTIIVNGRIISRR